MPQFMIELEHDPEECIQALEQIEPNAPDLLDETYWGCISGKHSGWVVVDAEDEAEAWEMVPQDLRDKAKVTRVELVTPELAVSYDPESAPFGMEKSQS